VTHVLTDIYLSTSRTSVSAYVRTDTLKKITPKYPQVEFPLMLQRTHVRNVERIHVRPVLVATTVCALYVRPDSTSMFIIRTATVPIQEIVSVALVLSGPKT